MAVSLEELTAQFLKYRDQLMAFICGLVRDPGAAEDIFQEVWVRLSSFPNQDPAIEDVPKWCRGVARNLILHYWREKRCSKVIADSELLGLAEQAFDEHGADLEHWAARREALVECLRQLPDKSRELLRLKYEQGLSSASIAQRLRSTPTAILMALSRLRKALARCIEQRLGLAEEKP